MNAVLAEDRSAACRHPHSCKCVAIDLVLLNHPLAFLMLKQKQVVTNLWLWILNAGDSKRWGNDLNQPDIRYHIYHVNASMLSIMDLVMPYNGAAVGSNLDPRQGVTVDVVTFYQTPPISKYVHPSLVTIEYSISPEMNKSHYIKQS